MSNIFSQFGTVVYVSIPRQQDGSVKGSAFIEFSDEAAATAAVAASHIAGLTITSKSAWLDGRSRQKSSAAAAVG
jgi:RNA recognition motif-containing protein